VADPTAKEPAQ